MSERNKWRLRNKAVHKVKKKKESTLRFWLQYKIGRQKMYSRGRKQGNTHL